MVKGKRSGLTFTECSVKMRRILSLHHHIENEATTMQRNRSAQHHLVPLHQGDFTGWNVMQTILFHYRFYLTATVRTFLA